MRAGNMFDVAVAISFATLSVTAAVVQRTVTPSVSIDKGIIKGFTDASGNSVFLGIPFAESTGGVNRYVIHCTHEAETYAFWLDGKRPRV
jgi:hypothetical protein